MSEASVFASKLAAISNAFTLENRFKKNFEIMSQIGIGGFAKVVKARNHLDDMEYAIKKIKIETRNKSASEIVNELDQILTEIRCFAKIKHKHIVRYNHSWIEVKLKENQTNDQSDEENKLLKNTDKINKNIKTQIKNCKKSTKRQKSYDHSDNESSGNSYNFTDESYQCEISWEGIDQSDNFKPNEKEYKKLNQETEKVSSFDPSFYLEQEENDSLPFDCNKNEKICAEYECEFSEFDFQAIGKVKNNNKTVNKRYALEDEYDCNDSENEINFVKSISRINKISEEYIYDPTHRNIKQTNKNDIKALLKNETDELKVHVNGKEYKFPQIKKFTIFLQMELCKQTLEDFLREKIVSKKFAESLNNNINNFFCNNIASFSYHREVLEKLEIFLEITKAINYLHESENIIHRDIKPQNIFFSLDGNVKLGDFGLATNFHNEKYNEIENSKNRKNSLESKATTVTRSSSPPTYVNTELNNKMNSNENCTFYHTKNIGTLLYSSPEQLNDNFYDYKSDVYSMGLVLFELLHPFITQMEKNMKFEQIKKGKIPPCLHLEEPVLAKLILAMCEPDPKQRPNTKEIMKILLKEISNKYFLVLESNASEDAELPSLKDFEYQNYFRANSKNLSVTSLNFGENVDFKASSNLFQAENNVDLDLKKASSYETCDRKLNLLRNTLKFIKKTEDFCVDITNDNENLRLFSVKDFQEIKSRKFEKVMLSNTNCNKTLTKSVNLPVEEIQNKRLRLLNSEIEANYNKENVNTNNIPFGIGYLFEKEYETKEKQTSEKQSFNSLQEKNKVFIRMFENNLLLFHRPNSNKADKVFDLLESRVNLKPNLKNNLTQLSLEIPFYSSVCIFLENSRENNEIIQRIKYENFLN